MKYFQISASSEPDIIGVRNGIYQLEINEKTIIKDEKYTDFINWFNHKNLDFWIKQGKIELLDKPYITGVMLKKAKVTDIMGYAPEYYYLNNLYSEKYIDIIREFDIGIQTIFPVKIENIDSPYYLMYINTIASQQIKFNKSIIITGHKILNNLKYYPINSYKDFLDLLEIAPLATFEKIAVSKEYFGRDIISIQATGGHFYSEKIIDFLLDCGIKGLQVSYNNSIQLEFV